MIYFVEAIGLNLVKIGFTERDVAFRLAKMATDSPVKLALLLTIEGTLQDEALIHECLKLHRVHGEWFSLTATVKSFMADIVPPAIESNVISITIKTDRNTAVEEYFDAHDESPSGLAQKIGVSPSTITRALRGERQPSFKLAQDIESATNGQVTAKDFIAACMDAEKARSQPEVAA